MLDEVAQLNTSEFATYDNPISFFFYFQFMLRKFRSPINALVHVNIDKGIH